VGIAQLKDSIRNIDRQKTLLAGMVDRSVRNQCGYCGHTLFLGQLAPGSLIEVKCVKCRECTPFGVSATVG
jgi:hypothetical protein